jgi:hypothetical protein
MPDSAKKKSTYKPLPISEQAYLELQKKYSVPVDELRRMAKELKMARPKLEMHLAYLAMETKKQKEK